MGESGHIFMMPNRFKAPRVVMYSHDGFGLGHARRNMLLAREAARSWQGASILMITGHPLFGIAEPLPLGIDYIKLPSIIKTRTSQWEPRSLPIDQKELASMRASMIRHATSLMQPDLFLVDYTPSGVWGELVPTLETLRRQSRRTQIVLGLRDILDKPEVTRRIWRSEGSYKIMRDLYDGILIYGQQDFFDTARAYGLDGELASKVFYTGYMSSAGTALPGREARLQLGIKEQKLVVVTAGGGGDAFPMMHKSLQAVHRAGDQLHGTRVVMITGPFMDGEQRELLASQTAGRTVDILDSSNHTLDYLAAADVVITMAGYNTLMDAVQLGKNPLVIPRSGPSHEQQMRAHLFHERGLITALPPPEQLSVSLLAECLLQKLTSATCSSPRPNMEGQKTAIATMTNLLENRSARKTLPVQPIDP